MRSRVAVLGISFLIFAAAQSRAAVVISSAATSDMSCVKGVCVPTAADAVLNVSDLEKLLAAGDVEVKTTASGVQANDVAIRTALAWSTASMLSLDAYHSVRIYRQVSVAGTGGISIVTNDGGTAGIFGCEESGQITFANLSSALSINGVSYTLVDSIKSLAAAVTANPSGAFALAANYNASADGTYAYAPIQTTFTGAFDGLGNVISNLAISDQATRDNVGLFIYIESPASVEHVKLRNINIHTTDAANTGGLAAVNSGSLFEDSVTGAISSSTNNGDDIQNNTGGLTAGNRGTIDGSSTVVTLLVGSYLGTGPDAGGLVGVQGLGSIVNSRATGSVVTSVKGRSELGGLVGALVTGSIATSFATGNVSCVEQCSLGGLIGVIETFGDGAASVANSYATGSVTAKRYSRLGGLIGSNGYARSDYAGSVDTSYSTGAVSGGKNSKAGGLIGYDYSVAGSLSDCYWDTDTSGITNLSQGAGYPSNDPGVTGLTTAQLQSGLPAGFDPLIWAEKKNLNNGLPYLLTNPPK